MFLELWAVQSAGAKTDAVCECDRARTYLMCSGHDSDFRRCGLLMIHLGSLRLSEIPSDDQTWFVYIFAIITAGCGARAPSGLSRLPDWERCPCCNNNATTQKPIRATVHRPRDSPERADDTPSRVHSEYCQRVRWRGNTAIYVQWSARKHERIPTKFLARPGQLLQIPKLSNRTPIER